MTPTLPERVSALSLTRQSSYLGKGVGWRRERPSFPGFVPPIWHGLGTTASVSRTSGRLLIRTGTSWHRSDLSVRRRGVTPTIRALSLSWSLTLSRGDLLPPTPASSEASRESSLVLQ